MKLFHSMLVRAVWCMGVLGILVLITGCDDSGNVTDLTRPAPGSNEESTIDERNLSAVAQQGDPSQLRPVERLARAQYARVGEFPLQESDLNVLMYPSATADERAAVMEGLTFFTFPHTADEGAGPVANQRMCLGCHTNSFEQVTTNLDGTPNGIVGREPGTSSRLSQVSRAARATPTNFDFTAFDPSTGGGRPAGTLDDRGRLVGNLDAVTNTGHTAAFTIFGNFSPSGGTFDSLEIFNGTVQHTRPSLPGCLPDSILPIEQDPFLRGGIDPTTGLSPLGLRRSVGERAGPPYIGRGLMEAIFDGDLVAQDDPDDDRFNNASSLNIAADFPECRGDCISGRHNENTSNQAFVGGDPVVRVGRFGLRAAGPTMLQFITGGVQGELGFTTLLTPVEPFNTLNVGRPGCQENVPDPDLPVSALLSCRNLVRLTAPPEFGTTLLTLLQSADPNAPQLAGSRAEMVRRGAELFGLDIVAFANRMIPAKTQAGRTDGRDRHARAANRMLDCAGCHTPVHVTGVSPSEVGARHLSNVWAPIFSDLLLHAGPVINAERFASTPRLPLVITRTDARGTSDTFDLPRNLADDTLPNQGLANGTEFRTPPLMGMGVMGPPFLHDARVYLSNLSNSPTLSARNGAPAPAGTVTTNSTVTNAPLIVRTIEDVILAVIEMHDLPAPDDANTTAAVRAAGGGCPVPNPLPTGSGRQGEIFYSTGAAEICPPYDSTASRANRGEARKTMRRFRALTPADQQALIEFLREL